jgi:hypothetical protein
VGGLRENVPLEKNSVIVRFVRDRRMPSKRGAFPKSFKFSTSISVPMNRRCCVICICMSPRTNIFERTEMEKQVTWIEGGGVPSPRSTKLPTVKVWEKPIE